MTMVLQPDHKPPTTKKPEIGGKAPAATAGERLNIPAVPWPYPPLPLPQLC